MKFQKKSMLGEDDPVHKFSFILKHFWKALWKMASFFFLYKVQRLCRKKNWKKKSGLSATIFAEAGCLSLFSTSFCIRSEATPMLLIESNEHKNWTGKKEKFRVDLKKKVISNSNNWHVSLFCLEIFLMTFWLFKFYLLIHVLCWLYPVDFETSKMH